MKQAWKIIAAAAIPLLFPRPGSAAVSFAVDPRVELLSSALMLSRPQLHPGSDDDYAQKARATFSPAANDPVVARLSMLLKRGVPAKTIAGLLLQVSNPPHLAVNQPLSKESLASIGGRKEAEALLAELRDFAKRWSFEAFYEAHRPAYAAFADAALKESLHAISPEAVAAYMGLSSLGEHHFILAPLFPDEPGDDPVARDGGRALHIRPRSFANGKAGFLFDTFEHSAAHAMSYDATRRFQSSSPDIRIALADAVGVRLLALDLGEEAYLAALRDLSVQRRPLREAISEQLKEYEASRSRFPTLQAFYPRLKPLLSEAARADVERRLGSAIMAARGRDQDLPQAERLLDGLIKELPQDADLRVERAALAARKGASRDALAFLAQARALNPGRATRLRMVGLYKNLHDAQAQIILDDLIREFPEDAALRIERAELAAQAGADKAALILLEEAQKLGLDRAARHKSALIRQNLKDYEGALAILTSLALEKAEPAILSDLGLCKYLAGRPDEAIADLKAAIKLDPRSLPAYLTLASIYAARGQFELERGVYESAPPTGGDPALRELLLKSLKKARARVKMPL